MSANTDLIRSLYDAFGRGDVPTVVAAMHPQIEWTDAEGFPTGGTYVGPDAVLSGVFGPIMTDWDGFSVTPNEFIDAGDTVVSLGQYAGTYKGTGKAMSADFAHVWTLRDGKAVRFRQYADSHLVQEAMRS